MKSKGSFKKVMLQKCGSLFWGFLGGILGGVLYPLIFDMITLHQARETYSELSVDKTQFRQGIGSLRWEIAIQPKRRYLFSNTEIIGALMHFEVIGNKRGKVQGLNFHNIKGIKFYGKASQERFHISEVNLFIGNNSIQYIFSKQNGLIVDTKWQEYFIPLAAFNLAPWLRNSNMQNKAIPDISNVTAFGFDLKTTKKPINAKIWIDYIRLIDNDGKEILFSDADKKDFFFQNKHIKWISDWREYPQFK